MQENSLIARPGTVNHDMTTTGCTSHRNSLKPLSHAQIFHKKLGCQLLQQLSSFGIAMFVESVHRPDEPNLDVKLSV